MLKYCLVFLIIGEISYGKKKQVMILGVLLVILVSVLSGCLDNKGKFIGTWTTSGGGGYMTFTNDNNVIVTSQLGNISLSGTYTWAFASKKITFTSELGGSVGVTLDYRFPTDNQLILTGSNGGSVTLNKA